MGEDTDWTVDNNAAVIQYFLYLITNRGFEQERLLEIGIDVAEGLDAAP